LKHAEYAKEISSRWQNHCVGVYRIHRGSFDECFA
jgi:hypothetical protein